ncbi:MAG: ATP-binding cassette domain-containing protein [Gaiellaceae bacterium]
MTIVLGALVGAALLGALSRGRARPSRRRIGLGAALALGGAGEEVVWRGVVLARLAAPLGVVAALGLTTAGFAATHVPAFGIRGGLVHCVTGGVFGGVFVLTGSLGSAIAAHATYNALVALGEGEPVASLRGVHKRLGGVAALRGVDLDVRGGEIVALLGPNGAGKTTLVNVLLGLRRPDRGTVTVRGSVGATPQGMGFPPTVRVEEVIDFVRKHYPDPISAPELLGRFGLAGLERRQVGGLSGGEARRLAVAVAFAGAPALGVLDEPTTGLDVEARRAVWSAVRAFADAGGAILLTTHALDEARALADRIVVIAAGAIVAQGSPAELEAQTGLGLEEAFLALTSGRP